MKSRLSLGLVVIGAACSMAADWPQFRGPNGSGVSTEAGLPTGFTGTSGLRWKVDVVGRGIGSPAIVGGKVYITSSSGVRDDRLHVLAYEAGSGKLLWQRQFAATGGTAAHPTSCMAAPSPVANSQGVFALFATGDIAALSPEGDLLWYRSLVSDYPTITNQVGMAASPILFENKLIVPMDNAGESFIAALDIKTGENVWKTNRPRDINWTTPLLRKNGDKHEILFQGPRDLVSFDASTGAKLWTAKIGSSIPTGTLLGDQLVTGGSGTAIVQLDGANVKELWKSPRLQTGMSSPLYYDGRIYAAASSGIVVCADAKTGKPIWDIRLKGPFSGSPIAGDGKVYLINEAGILYTLKAGGDSGEIITQSDTKDKGQATPAISGGAIFIRGEKSLICIGDKLGG